MDTNAVGPDIEMPMPKTRGKVSAIGTWYNEHKNLLEFTGHTTDTLVYNRMKGELVTEVGCVPKAVDAYFKRHNIQYPTQITKSVKHTQEAVMEPTEGLKESEMRAKYDPLFQLREAVKQLPIGKYYPEAVFREMFIKNNNPGFRTQSERPEFEAYRGKAGGTTYWSHPDSIAKLKKDRVLI